MTAGELVRRVLDVARNYKTLYVMGCFGAPLNAKNKERYTRNHPFNEIAARTKMIRAAAEDTFGFDCVCLIKGILWGWTGDKSKSYGGAVYGANGVPDIGANTMIGRCRGVTADFTKIVPGAAVWTDGHIGVYVGDGLAVECSPAWGNCVQLTAVGSIGPKDGYPTRRWKKWGLLPWIEYEEEIDMTEEQVRRLVREELAAVQTELRAQTPAQQWLVDGVARAVAEGLTDGSSPMAYCTRGEAMILASNAVKAAKE